MLAFLLSLFYVAVATVVAPENVEPGKATVLLSNNLEFPLMGMGVGNLQHEKIVEIIQHGRSPDLGIRLIDTAHASKNEHLVNEGILQSGKGGTLRGGMKESLSDGKKVHVVTKVWYTHLGYERTKLSVRESLKNLSSSGCAVHILLHWPRCRDDISWMDCAGEEERLPQYVKDVDSNPPHLSPEIAWKESWRALEDMYMNREKEYPALSSIGVSNFELNDLSELVSTSRVTPHIFQGNIWTLLFDPHLTNLLKEHSIHFQAYNVMNGVFSRASAVPNALFVLEGESAKYRCTPAQVLLAWLVHQKVSVIPRTSNIWHLKENSPSSLPRLSSHFSEETAPAAKFQLQNQAQQQSMQVNVKHVREDDMVRNAVESLVRQQDLDQPKVSFVNNHSSGENLHVFWSNPSGEEIPVKKDLRPGDSFQSASYTGHVFVVYDQSKEKRKEYRVDANYGEEQRFHIDEL